MTINSKPETGLGTLATTTSLTPLTYPSHAEMQEFMTRMMAGDAQSTEAVNARAPEMDTFDAILEGQLRAISAVGVARPQIEKAVQAIVERLQPDGRLIYVGTGTSGRLGAVDGMELGPTFDFPDDRVIFAMAEDPEFKTGTSREGREDETGRADEKIEKLKLRPSDVVIALAASGTTPYTRRFAQVARKAGALVVGMSNNPDAPLLEDVDCPILLKTGAEAVRGSTRMGAGTAQKSALTLLSTLVMEKLPGIFGIYKGIMINMREAANQKLTQREIQTIIDVMGCPREEAVEALNACGHDMKQAILVIGMDSTPEAAKTLLEGAGRNLAMILQNREISRRAGIAGR